MKPPGWFIHEFAATTEMAPKMPLAATGIPDQKCAHPRRRRHPYRYTPTKIASRKKKIPSTLKGRPITAP